MLPQAMLIQERYRVLEHIGRGGMGSVYLAEDLRLHTTVALKQMLVTGNRLSDAFIREAQLLAALRHPTIPRVIDHFIDQNGQFLVMEYIPGDDIGAILTQRQRPFGLDDVLQWADQLLGALDYLHGYSPAIIHRDIKPQNLKLTAKNEIVLLDFGLAKSSLANAASTESIFGYTPHYAPLEQIHGQGTDARTDLYSLGATLYHLLTGQTPVDAVSRASALVNDQPDPLPPPDALNPQLPPAIAAVLLGAMSLKAADRPQSAAELRERLRLAASDPASIELAAGPSSGWLAARSDAQAPTRAKSTIRLPVPAAGKRPATWQIVLGAGTALAVVAAGAFGLSAIRGSTAAPTAAPTVASLVVEPMQGSLNIAVADFAPLTTGDCAVKPDEASGLAGVVYTTLREQLQTAKGGASATGAPVDLGDIELRSPEQTGTLAAGADRAQAAAQKASELNADIVLYGDVACTDTPRQTTLSPQIYISDRKLQSFDQLLFIGAHPFGTALVSPGLPTSGPTRQQIAEGLVPRMSVITQFFVGLDYYYAGLFDQAAPAFTAAAGVAGFDDPFITSMVTLYRGTNASRLRQFDQAQESYRQVLALDPANQTARYSLADATYWKARGDCTPAGQPGAADPAGLKEALDLLQQINAPADTLIDRTIRGMTAYISGHIYACMTQAGIPDDNGQVNNWATAEQQYKQALELLDQQQTFARDFVAEAHAGLAYVYLSDVNQQDRATVDARWRRAAVEYCEASKLSGYAFRQTAFLHRLAAIHGYLGEYDQAEIERQKAIQFDPGSAAQYDGGLHKQWLADKQTTPSKDPIWTCEQQGAS